MPEQSLLSPVWRMKGIFGAVTPALLQLDAGIVSLIGNQGTIFEVPLADVKDVKWPKLQMGFGFEATVNGEKVKLTFMKPNGAANLDDSVWAKLPRVTRLGQGIDSMITLAKAGESKRAANEWRAVLGG